MSAPPGAPPPNYAGTPSQQYYDQKSQYGPGQFSPPPQQQQYPPPPTSPQQYAPPPTTPQQYPPPPGQTPSQNQQQYYPPPPQQQQQQQQPLQRQYTSPPPPSPAQFAPPPQQPAAQAGGTATTVSDTIGTFDGGQFRIDHRDSNTILSLNLQPNQIIYAKPGAMVAMSPKVTLKGSFKINFKKFLAGSEMSHSTYTGPGEVILAPPALGDIIPIRLDGQTTWSVGKDAYLASTPNVKKDLKTQGLGKAFFSGEGLFVYKISGSGILWITSLGAIISKHLMPGEDYIVDNDHLVAWNCKYTIERIASGGMLSGMAASEGLVCRFSGPGTVFVQTRNPTAFGQWMATRMGSGGGGGGLSSFLG